MTATLTDSTDRLLPRGGRGAFAARKASRTGCAMRGWPPGRPTSACRCRQRTDEEWRRTDLRALKLDRLAPVRRRRRAGRLARRRADVGRRRRRLERERARRRHRPARRLDGLHRGRRRPGRPGRDLHRSRHGRPRARRTWSSSYFMTEAVPVDFGKFEALHAAFWQGGTFLYVPKGVTVELPFRSFAIATDAGRVGLHPHAGRARGGRRGVLRRRLPLARRRRSSRSPPAWSS